jgi:hypothetical protein
MAKKPQETIAVARMTVMGTIIVAVISLLGNLVLGYWEFIFKPGQANSTATSTIVPSGTQTNDHIGSPSALVSITFKVNGYMPRVVDMRSSANVGIPVWPENALKFSEVWVNTTEGSITKYVSVEFYANGNIFIGSIDRTEVQPGLTKLSEAIAVPLYVDKYIGNNYWKVENSWTTIDVVQINYDENGNKVAVSQFPIKLNPESDAWLVAPPDVSIMGFAYSINNGAEIWAGVDTLSDGLQIKAGDTLSITRVIYNAEFADPEKSFGMEAEIYGMNDTYSNNSGYNLTRGGVNVLSGFATPFVWTINSNATALEIGFARADGTVIDQLLIPILQK